MSLPVASGLENLTTFCAVIADFFRCERRDQDNGAKLAGQGLGGFEGGINAGEQFLFSTRSVGHLSSAQEWHRHFVQ